MNAAFLGSSEKATRGADGRHGIIFARPAYPDDLSAVVSLQSGGMLAQLVTNLFGSAEFTARANATVG